MTDTIKELSLKSIDDREQEDVLIKEMHIIKSGYVMEIESQWEEFKDKSLSNQTKRNVAVDELLLADEAYTTSSESLTKISKIIKLDTIELAFQTREFQRKMKE